MDSDRFDALAKHLATAGASRRRLLRGVGGGLLAALGGAGAAGAAPCASGVVCSAHCCPNATDICLAGQCASCPSGVVCSAQCCAAGEQCLSGRCTACPSGVFCSGACCAAGETCQAGTCASPGAPGGNPGSLGCSSNADCRIGYCDNGYCIVKHPGASCSESKECATGYCYLETSAGGFCANYCDLNAPDCNCVGCFAAPDTNSNAGFCATPEQDCNGDSACPAGQVCVGGRCFQLC